MDWMIFVVGDAFLLILATLAIAVSGLSTFRRRIANHGSNDPLETRNTKPTTRNP